MAKELLGCAQSDYCFAFDRACAKARSQCDVHVAMCRALGPNV
jgi:hypothetical protein